MDMVSMAQDSSHTTADAHLNTLVVIFDVLQIAGFLSLGAITITAYFSSRVTRSWAWYAFLTSWIWCSASYSILIGQQTGDLPHKGTCTAQAILVYAAPILPGGACLALALQLYFSINALFTHSRIDRARRTTMIIMLPLILYLVVFVETLIIVLLKPQFVRRIPSKMYCGISDPVPIIITGAIVLALCVCILVVQGMTAVLLYKNWASFRQLQPLADNGLSYETVARLMSFNVFGPLLSASLGLLNFDPNFGEDPVDWAIVNIMTGALPLITALLFGSQKDILRVWMFWKTTDPIPPAVNRSVLTSSSRSKV